MEAQSVASEPLFKRRVALQRYRAERLLRRDFNDMRERVLTVVRSRLRGMGMALDRGDVEACYAIAWHGLYAAVTRGEEIEDATAWLTVVTFRRAIDESRALAGRRPSWGAELDDGRQQVVAPQRETLEMLADKAKLSQLFAALQSRLSDREREAVTLCFLQGFTRAEAAAQMGVSQARMRKLMDGVEGRPGVTRKFSELVKTVGAEGWCEQQDSLMRAYAFGLLDSEGRRHRLAVAHVRECPACRRWVACLRGLAVVLPPLPLPAPSVAPAKTRLRLRLRRPTAFTPKLATVAVVTATIGGAYATLVKRAPAHRGAASTPARTLPAHTAVARHDRRPRRRHRRVIASGPPSPPPPSAPPAPRSEPSPRGGEFGPEQTRP